jgi:hypothetical protein
MKLLLALAAVCAIPALARAQSSPGGFGSARSVSGQFVVYAAEPGLLPSHAATFAADPDLITLQPALLAVSCERIKQAVWHELGSTSPWRGKIFLKLAPARSADDPVTVISEKFNDGWGYRVELPDVLERGRFVRLMTRMVLLELANRGAGEHPAEIPAWLVEGLSRQLLATRAMELLLPPPTKGVGGVAFSLQITNAQRLQPLEQSRRELTSRTPLTFEQLSWPTDGDLAGDSENGYRASAQLFVSRLLRFDDGQARLRAFLEKLPQFYNWQTAFLEAFRPHFERPLDVEKWWALQVAEFTGRDERQTWPPDESWRKLDEALHAEVDVRSSAAELPLRSTASLQTIIREANTVEQVRILQNKLRELDGLRLRVFQPLVPVVDDYRNTLQTYLQERQTSGSLLSLARLRWISGGRATETALQRLNSLDARREALRPAAPAKIVATDSGAEPPSMDQLPAN